MSNALRKLAAAIDEFAHRPSDDRVTEDQLQDLISKLEYELEYVDDPDPATAKATDEADVQAAKNYIFGSFGQVARSSIGPEPDTRIGP
jgi:hypothetical protein